MKLSQALIMYKKKDNMRHILTCYLLLALPIIGFVVFTIYPILWTLYKSLFSYTGVPSETRFIGFENYLTLFADSEYWNSWKMTLQYAIIKIPLEAVLAFITAYFLTLKIKGANFFRSLYYLPAIFSVAIIGLIFSNIFDYFGIVNGLLVKIGILSEKIDWFSQKWTAFSALLVGGLWNSFGTSVLYYMAALANVPKELYESADIDGASELIKIIKIALPMILPIVAVLLLLSISGCLHVNEYVLVMTNGAPAGSTHTVLSYQTSKIVPGFGTVGNIGYSATMSCITSVLFCCVGIVYSKLSKKLNNIV